MYLRGSDQLKAILLGAIGYVNPFGNYIPYSTSRLWDLLTTGRVDDAKKIQRLAEDINDIIAEGHPMYGHQCYSKALAGAAGYPMGDVRLPLTTFEELGKEGTERRDRMVSLMNEVEMLAKNMQVKVRTG